MRAVLVSLALSTLATCGDAESTSSPPATAPTALPTTTAAPVSNASRAPVDPTAPVAELAAGFNDAGFELLRTQPIEADIVFSPASIGHALLMARAAADPTTAAAIDAAFTLPADPTAHAAWNAIDQEIAGAQTDTVTVALADRIWPRLDAAPDQAWLDLLASDHGASTERLDLRGDPDGSRDRINGWISDQTHDLIPELLSAGFITPQTMLVLTDALYFEAEWAMPFGKYGPVDGTFTRLDGTTVEVEYMQELELGDRRGQGDGFVGAELPYAGDQFSMLVLVPDEGRFADVRDQLSHELLVEIDATFTTGPYELRVPKWEDTTQLDLLPWLEGFGAAPGIYPAISPDAFLDGAVHGADIAVDEIGTVAAAATALGFPESGPPEPELVVAAERPFLYVIRHRPSGLVLFAGQVTDPTS